MFRANQSIPNLPIIAVAEDTKSLRVLPKSAAAPKPPGGVVVKGLDALERLRIGLFLQGDLKGAEQAFEKITEMDPQNPMAGQTFGARARCRKET